MPPDKRSDRDKLRSLLTDSNASSDPFAWQEYICAFHQATERPEISEFFRGALGRTSYEMLLQRVAQTLPPPRHVLDVGCGDGSFARMMRSLFPQARISGIDVCELPLVNAGGETDPSTIQYLAGDVTAIPFPAETFDVVTAHLVLMLVQPIEQALREIRRVLQNKGRCYFIVDLSDRAAGAYGDLRVAALEFIRGSYPNFVPPRLGDPRVKQPDAFTLLMRDAGLGEGLAMEDVEVTVQVTPQTVWPLFSGMYVFGSLDECREAALRKILDARLPRWTRPDGMIHITFPLRIISGGR